MSDREECGAWTMYMPADVEDDFIELVCVLPEGHVPHDVHETADKNKWKESEHTTIVKEE